MGRGLGVVVVFVTVVFVTVVFVTVVVVVVVGLEFRSGFPSGFVLVCNLSFKPATERSVLLRMESVDPGGMVLLLEVVVLLWVLLWVLLVGTTTPRNIHISASRADGEEGFREEEEEEGDDDDDDEDNDEDNDEALCETTRGFVIDVELSERGLILAVVVAVVVAVPVAVPVPVVVPVAVAVVVVITGRGSTMGRIFFFQLRRCVDVAMCVFCSGIYKNYFYLDFFCC